MDPPSVADEQNLHRDRLVRAAGSVSSLQRACAPLRMAWPYRWLAQFAQSSSGGV
jgi:hypothetical protein